MKHGIFVTGTGTDVGKTYVCALLVKALRESGVDVGYYKAAISGSDSIPESDAGYVKKVSGISQPDHTLVSYLYHTAVSPHLAAQIERNPVELARVQADFQAVCAQHEFVVMEGSGGIVCPIRHDDKETIFLEDIILKLGLDTLVVSDAGLGSINAAVLTVSYLRQKHIPVAGLFLNRYRDTPMHADNHTMIASLTGLPVFACIPEHAQTLPPLTPEDWNLIKGV